MASLTPTPLKSRRRSAISFGLPSRASLLFSYNTKHTTTLSPIPSSSSNTDNRRRKSSNRAARIIEPRSSGDMSLDVCPQLPPLSAGVLGSFAESSPNLSLPQYLLLGTPPKHTVDIPDQPFPSPRPVASSTSTPNLKKETPASSADALHPAKCRPSSQIACTRAKIPSRPPPPPPLLRYSSVQDLRSASLSPPPSTELPPPPPPFKDSRRISPPRVNTHVPRSRRYGISTDHIIPQELLLRSDRPLRSSFLPSMQSTPSSSVASATTVSSPRMSPLSLLTPVTPSDASSEVNSPITLDKFPSPPSLTTTVPPSGVPIFTEAETTAVKDFLRRRWEVTQILKSGSAAQSDHIEGLGLQECHADHIDKAETGAQHPQLDSASDFSWHAEDEDGAVDEDEITQVIQALRAAGSPEPVRRDMTSAAQSEATHESDPSNEKQSGNYELGEATHGKAHSDTPGGQDNLRDVSGAYSSTSSIIRIQDAPSGADKRKARAGILRVPTRLKKSSSSEGVRKDPRIRPFTSPLDLGFDRDNVTLRAQSISTAIYSSQVSLAETVHRLSPHADYISERGSASGQTSRTLSMESIKVTERTRPQTIKLEYNSALDRLEQSMVKLKGHEPHHQHQSKSLDLCPSPVHHDDGGSSYMEPTFFPFPSVETPTGPARSRALTLQDTRAPRLRSSHSNLREVPRTPVLLHSASTACLPSGRFLDKPYVLPEARTHRDSIEPPEDHMRSFMNMGGTPEPEERPRRTSMGAEKMKQIIKRASKGLIGWRKSLSRKA